MKSLKFDHRFAALITQGSLRVTWRLGGQQEVTVGEAVQLVDKVDPERPQTWKVSATARITRLIDRKLSEVGTGDFEGSGQLDSDDIVTTVKAYYSDVEPSTAIVTLIYFDVTDDTDNNDVTDTSNMHSKLQLYTDGGSRGNPGPSAAGYVIVDPHDGSVLVDTSVYLGITGNNMAEYIALKYGLETAARMAAREVVCYLDSMLVVNQMKSIFKNKNRELWPVHDAIRSLAGSFDTVTYTHVPREQNHLADAAVNRVLDTAAGSTAAIPVVPTASD